MENHGPRTHVRRWWLTAAVAALVDRVFTFAYFIPTMLTLMQDKTLAQSAAVDMAMQWGNLNYLRHVIVFVAWVAALQTFKQGEIAEVSE